MQIPSLRLFYVGNRVTDTVLCYRVYLKWLHSIYRHRPRAMCSRRDLWGNEISVFPAGAFDGPGDSMIEL